MKHVARVIAAILAVFAFAGCGATTEDDVREARRDVIDALAYGESDAYAATEDYIDVVRSWDEHDVIKRAAMATMAVELLTGCRSCSKLIQDELDSLDDSPG